MLETVQAICCIKSLAQKSMLDQKRQLQNYACTFCKAFDEIGVLVQIFKTKWRYYLMLTRQDTVSCY